jgi:polyribonucleotide 5'-hydroxyl-kinase
MPIGMKTEDNLTKLVSILPNNQTILNHVLSVSTATSAEDNIKVIESNLLGFVCVTNVDSERQMVTLLSPQQRPLPLNSILLLSEVQFMDSH